MAGPWMFWSVVAMVMAVSTALPRGLEGSRRTTRRSPPSRPVGRLASPLTVRGGGRFDRPPASPSTVPGDGGGGGRLERFLGKLFDEADTNKDGSISVTEAYELILKMYVQINRQAPINPPSREKVDTLFRNADADRNGRLSRTEFKRLALVLASRASTRLVAHKVIKLFVAPILAVKLVHELAQSRWVNDIISPKIPSKAPDFIRKVDLWKTVVTVLFVATLGNLVLGLVTFVLDVLHLKDAEETKDAEVTKGRKRKK